MFDKITGGVEGHASAIDEGRMRVAIRGHNYGGVHGEAPDNVSNVLDNVTGDAGRIEARHESEAHSTVKPEAAVHTHSVCKLCSEADFASLLREDPERHSRCIVHFTKAEILAKTECPLGRLIAHHIRSFPDVDEIPDETGFALCIIKDTFEENDGTPSADSQQTGGKRPHRLEVLPWTTILDPRAGKAGVNYRTGIILPVKGSKTHTHKSHPCPGAPFSTPGHDGPIHARWLGATVDTGLLKDWSNFCESSHRKCKTRRPHHNTQAQVRLIDVHGRRLVDSSLHERYLALSYVWGDSTIGLLTSQTIAQFQCEGSLDEKTVPRLLSDAMDLVAQLGERYLWVDIACIIQDDIYDKQRQLPIMDDIYSHASLTIIAAVENANANLPRWRSVPGSQHVGLRCTEMLNGEEYVLCQPSLEVALSQATWSSRGWYVA